jgi:hypothetical protein
MRPVVFPGFRPGKLPKMHFVRRRCSDPTNCPLTHCGCGNLHHIDPDPRREPQPLVVCARDPA